MPMQTRPVDSYLQIAPEVEQALNDQQAVVALETTVVSHGLPYPANIEAAQTMQQAIRAEGAVPALIGLRKGKIVIGLTDQELLHLATTPGIQKVSRRDIAITLAQKNWGATTVAGTMFCAHLAGIHFFATGGIGGVHRGAERSMDISADLQELSRTPVLVTCAGAKSILDLDLTLEYLETQGVPVLGWRTDEFPAFYVRNSGRPVSHRVDEIDQVAATAKAQWACNLHGIIVACPIPDNYALEPGPLEAAIDEALALARKQNIRGSAVTPFVLSQVAQLTQGESIEANKALLVNNAQWAARFARAYVDHQEK